MTTRSGRADERHARGRQRTDASFPAPPAKPGLPESHAALVAEIKERIRDILALQIERRLGLERLRVVLAANAELVLLYWDVGRAILERQNREGWGAKVIDRLSHDLRDAFPDMRGLSPRNLKYMRSFAAAWPDRRIVQQVAAQLPWFHNAVLLDKVKDPQTRLWYARRAREEGWSRNVLALQIDGKLHEREGKAVTNFAGALPSGDSDMATEVFKDPYLFDFLGTAAPSSTISSASSSSSVPALLSSAGRCCWRSATKTSTSISCSTT